MSENLVLVPLVPGRFSEADWVFRLLRPVSIDMLAWSETTPVIPGALYLHHGPEPLRLPDSFLAAIRDAGGCGLLHLGDEYYRAPLPQYGSFDYVVRMFPWKAARHEGVMAIPVGYTPDLGVPVRKPASEREYMWMFAGDWKADRNAMAGRFRSIPGGFLSLTKSFEGERGISRRDYLSVLSRSVFAPSPAGNVLLETCRPFEALELGAIPIIPRRRRADPFADHFGRHPMPAFMDWREASDFVERLSRDPRGLDQLQNECVTWWEAEKDRLSGKLLDFIDAGRNGAFGEALHRRFGHQGAHDFERLLEMLAQQNSHQIAARIGYHCRRIFKKHILRNEHRGIWSVEGATTEDGITRPDRTIE